MEKSCQCISFYEDSCSGVPLDNLSILSMLCQEMAFFTQVVINGLGFTNAQFIYNQRHFLDSGLKGMFPTSYDLLKGHLISMVNASNESDYECILTSANNLLQSQTSKNNQDTKDLRVFAENCGIYAEYMISNIVGNCGLHGLTASEQNHTSVLMYLNDGVWGKNNHYNHPILLIKDLLCRQKNQVNKTNAILFGQSKMMDIEICSLKKDQYTNINKQPLQAAQHLNFPEYESHKSTWQKPGTDYELIGSLGTFPVNVQTTRNPDVPPQVFESEGSQRNCLDRRKEEVMCVH